MWTHQKCRIFWSFLIMLVGKLLYICLKFHTECLPCNLHTVLFKVIIPTHCCTISFVFM